MTGRRGFTLIEITLAVVITGLVALLAYGAISTAADVRERLEADRAERQARAAWRDLVSSAVRSVRAPLEYDAATLVVQDGSDREGRPSDRVVVTTAAEAPPLAGGTDWRVTLTAESGRLSARAMPLDGSGGERVIGGPSGMTGLEVEVLQGGAWRAGWRSDVELPDAVRITFWSEDGAMDVPLVLALGRRLGR